MASNVQSYYYSLETPELSGKPVLAINGRINLRDSCSDTDSGICADSSSESQPSPKRLEPLEEKPIRKPNKPLPPVPPKFPSSRQGLNVLPNYPLGGPATSTKPSRSAEPHGSLPLKSTGSVSSTSSASSTSTFARPPVFPKKNQPLRVRFADEVATAAKSREFPPNGNVTLDRQRTLDRSGTLDRTEILLGNRTLDRTANITRGPVVNRAQFAKEAAYYYVTPNKAKTEENLPKNLPAPPPYNAACDRIKMLRGQVDDSGSRGRDARRFSSAQRNRSASLPRPHYIKKTLQNQSRENFDNARLGFNALTNAKSVECINSSERENRTGFRNHGNPCVVPSTSFNDILHISTEDLPAKHANINFEARNNHSNSLTRGAKTVKRFAHQAFRKCESENEVIRNGRKGRSQNQDQPDFKDIICFDEEMTCPDIRVRLQGLDSKGCQILELEKLVTGPFGFFIATGLYKRRKGIFVSRVSAYSLLPQLSVGDEILAVDSVSTKGKTLEQVQALIVGKQRILLKILPVILR